MIRIYLVLLCLSFLLFACKNDIAKINELTKDVVVPNMEMTDGRIVYTDSGKVKLIVLANEIKRFDLPKEPYTEFPKGINVTFYNSLGLQTSKITANFAVYYMDIELWEAKGNVIALNEKGEELHTEQLFWKQSEGKIYSNEFTKIISPDGVFVGDNGFESNQDFSRWRLMRSKGSVNVKDNE